MSIQFESFNFLAIVENSVGLMNKFRATSEPNKLRLAKLRVIKKNVMLYLTYFNFVVSFVEKKT